MKRVAIIGAGIGASHAEGFLQNPEGFEVAVICDLEAARAQSVADKCPGAQVTTSLDAVLARHDIDIVDVCLPPQLHFDTIVAALEAGKDVICEKPLVPSVADLDRIEEVATRTGRMIVPIYQYRYGNGLMKLRRLIDQGIAGAPLVATVSTHWNRLAPYYAVPWRGKKATELGGAIISHAIHAHDLVTAALGPAKSVFAKVSTRVNPIETEDCAAICLEMQSGALVTLSVTLGSAQEVTKMRFCFANLTAENDGLEPYRPASEPWRFIPRGELDKERIEAALAGYEPVRDRFAGLFQALHAAYQGKAPFPLTLDDARQSLELASAIYYSSANGEAVQLPLSPDHIVRAGWLPFLP